MSLFQNRSYKLLLSATAVSNLGDGVSALALPWLATLITRDPVMIALVPFASKLPWLLLSIPAGAWVDRADRQRLMVRADLIRMALTMGIIVLIFSIPAFPLAGGETAYIAALSVLAFLLGSAEVLRDNAAQTILPTIVKKHHLETANGQLWSAEKVMGKFIGPPLAGVLIALAVQAPFVLDAATFGVAACLVWAMSMAPRRLPARRQISAEIAEGWDWMRGHRMILRLAITLGCLNAISMMGFSMLVLVGQERLGLSAVGHGAMLTAGAVGGVLGGIAGPWLITQIGTRWSMRLALVLFPLSFVVIALSSNAYVTGAALFIEALAALIWNIVSVSWRQRIIPDELLGRVNSLYRFFAWGLMPLGALLGGWIVSFATPELGRAFALQLPYLLGALGLTVIAANGWVKLRL